MITSFENILVLAPHTDDGELGCGGTIAKCIENGKNVFYVAFSTARQSLPSGLPDDTLKVEVRRATELLGIPEDHIFIFDYEVRKLNYSRQDILEDLVKIRNSLDIDLVLMPTIGDIHQDHSTVAGEGLRAFKNKSILGYELIWNNVSINTQCFVTLDRKHVTRKVEALREYKSQSGKPYMSEEFVFSLARSRGVQIGADFAECYEVIRWIL